MSPAWLWAKTLGTLPSAGDSWPFRVAMRIRPGRSVTSMRPSGKNASDHGFTKPSATVRTDRSPAELGNVGSAALANLHIASTAPSVSMNLISVSIDAPRQCDIARGSERDDLAVGLFMRMMRHRQDGQPAYADKQKSENQRDDKQATFIVDYVASHIGARDTNRDDGRRDDCG